MKRNLAYVQDAGSEIDENLSSILVGIVQVLGTGLAILIVDRYFQGTIYRNTQLRYTHIMYCTLWEECKQPCSAPKEVEGKGLQLSM